MTLPRLSYEIGLRRSAYALPVLRGDGGLHLIDNCGERRLVHHCHVGQHLAVQSDRSFLQAIHEHAVSHAMLARCGIDTGDPQSAENAFLVAAVAIRILPRTHDRLLGDTKDFTATPTIAFGLIEDFLVTGPRCDFLFFFWFCVFFFFGCGLVFGFFVWLV